MEFQLGETYSGYHFLDILKRSKNGIEFRVRNTRAGRLEALRSLPQSAQDDQEQSERFLREMRVHASLLHPNIVTLFSAIELENHLIMTTELVEGPTLAEKLLLGPMPWAEAVALCRQALSAVACAHQQGIVHRDISPENIIITAGGVLKLANFSLAKGSTSPKLTQLGLVMGNLKYISPEQIKGMGDVDARSDLYSLGMVLYEMLCGRPAFECASHFELMAAHVVQTPVAPSEVNAAVPGELGAVVMKALAKEPAERYQTAAEFDEALGKVSEAPLAIEAVPARQEEPAAPPVAVAPLPLPPAPVQQPVIAAVEAPAPAVAAQPIPPLSPVPAFLTATRSPFMSRQELIIGSAAGACLGVLLVALWFIAK